MQTSSQDQRSTLQLTYTGSKMASAPKSLQSTFVNEGKVMQKNGLSYSGQWHKLGARLLPHPHNFFFISPCGLEHLPQTLGALLCKPHLLKPTQALLNQAALLHATTLWTRLRYNRCAFIKSLWGGETHALQERPSWVRSEVQTTRILAQAPFGICRLGALGLSLHQPFVKPLQSCAPLFA